MNRGKARTKTPRTLCKSRHPFELKNHFASLSIIVIYSLQQRLSQHFTLYLPSSDCDIRALDSECPRCRRHIWKILCRVKTPDILPECTSEKVLGTQHHWDFIATDGLATLIVILRPGARRRRVPRIESNSHSSELEQQRSCLG